jgi:hypothetical protein
MAQNVLDLLTASAGIAGLAPGAARPAPQRIVSGMDALTLYQFNTRVAKHYFCKHCGIYHQTRKDSNAWRVNLGCLDGVDPYALAAGVADGASLPVVTLEDA